MPDSDNISIEEIEHENAMAAEAVTRFENYATKAAQRRTIGEGDAFGALLALSLNRSIQWFRKNEDRFRQLHKPGRRSVAGMIWDGQEVTLTSTYFGRKTLHKWRSPNVLELAGRFGRHVYKLDPEAFRGEDGQPLQGEELERLLLEAGLRVLFALTIETILSTQGPHATREDDNTRTQRKNIRSVTTVGNAVGTAICDASLSLDLTTACEKNQNVADALMNGKYQGSSPKYRTDAIRYTIYKVAEHDRAQELLEEDPTLGLTKAKDQAKKEITDNYRQHRKSELKTWRQEIKAVVGACFVEIVVTANNWGEIVQPRKAEAELHISPRFFSDYAAFKKFKLTNERISWPLIAEPLEWRIDEEGDIRGGYHLNCGGDLFVRKRQTHSEIALACGSDAPFMRMVSNLQKTVYELNPVVVELLERLEQQDLNVGGFIVKNTIDYPVVPDHLKEPPEGVNTDSAEYLRWDRDRQELFAVNEVIHRKRRKELGRLVHTHNVMRVLRRFKGRQMWQAWSLDTRGRAYPLANCLSPQGPDFERACLRSAKGVPVEGSIVLPDGTDFRWTRTQTIYWAAVDLATKWGENAKDNWDGRYRWTFDEPNLKRILLVAADPWENLELWKDTDEPFQVVAACEEFARLLDGSATECKIFSSWDGTASGLQHLTAGCRDGELAPLVNIASNERPGDIYSVVSDNAGVLTEAWVQDGTLKTDPRNKTERLSYEWHYDRSAAKGGGCMTIPYGARPISCRKKLETQLAERNTPWIRPVLQNEQTEKDVDSRMADYSKVLWNAVIQTIRRPYTAMHMMRAIFNDWVKEQNKARAEAESRGQTDYVDQPLQFVGPSGFPAWFLVPTVESTEKGGFEMRIRIPNLSNGAARRMSLARKNWGLANYSQMRKSVAPGVVHAMDAALLHILLGELWPDCRAAPATVIHDALLCPAPLAPLMQELGRTAFHRIHQTNFLESFSKQALGFIHPLLLDEDEDTNVICRDPAVAWHPDDALSSKFLFS